MLKSTTARVEPTPLLRTPSLCAPRLRAQCPAPLELSNCAGLLSLDWGSIPHLDFIGQVGGLRRPWVTDFALSGVPPLTVSGLASWSLKSVQVVIGLRNF